MDHRKSKRIPESRVVYFIDYTKPLTVWITTNWKILKDIGIPLYLSPEKPVCRSRRNRTGHGTMDWFKIVKGVSQGCMLVVNLLI